MGKGWLSKAMNRRGARQSDAPPARGLRRRIPLSLAILGVLLLELALQWPPFPGIFLMFMGAPFWSAILVNAFLVTLAWDAYRRVLPRWVLVAPIGAYAAYGIAVAGSYLDYRSKQAEFLHLNSVQGANFDPQRDALVAPAHLAPMLVATYQLRVAYGSDRGSVTAYRVLPKADCDRFTARRSGPVFAATPVEVGDVRVDNLCLLKVEEPKPEGAFEVQNDLSVGSMRTVRVTAPDGRAAAYSYGTVEVLSPIPLPMVGCFINDAESRWQCVAQFVRFPARIGQPSAASDLTSNATALARLLQLKPRTVNAVTERSWDRSATGQADLDEVLRLASDRESALERATSLDKAHVEAAIKALPDYLRGADDAATRDVGLTLAPYAERTTPHADAMATALAEAVEADDPERQRNIGLLVSALPDAAFRRIGPRLLSLGKNPNLFMSAPMLLTRLGDLGTASRPVLLWGLVEKDYRIRTAAILGLCRGGFSEAATAIAAGVSWGDQFDERLASDIALKRLGRPDLAEKVAPHDEGRLQEVFEQKVAALGPIGPHSPPGRCRINLPWIDVPGRD